MKRKNFGFTLIELLVVIGIIAIVLALTMPNYMGMRQRARDTKRKAELGEIKTALRLYYNDYQSYPVNNGTDVIRGCGATGLLDCSTATTYNFAAGGAGADNVYMKKFPVMGVGGAQGWKYYSTGGDDFCLYVDLENPGDADAPISKTRCTSSCTEGAVNHCSGTATVPVYCLCAD
jgi:general secretion pathway protein G